MQKNKKQKEKPQKAGATRAERRPHSKQAGRAPSSLPLIMRGEPTGEGWGEGVGG